MGFIFWFSLRQCVDMIRVLSESDSTEFNAILGMPDSGGHV